MDNRLQKALEYYQNGDMLQARLLCSQVLSEDPDNTEVIFFLGIIYFQLGQYDEAIPHLEKFVQSSPSNAEAHHLLGMALQAKDIEKAIVHYRLAVEASPDYAEAYNNLGNALKEKGRLDEALANFQKAAQLDPGLAVAFRNIGVCMREMSRPDEAIRFFRKTIELDPHYAATYHLLAMTLEEKGNPEEAAENYRKAFSLDPSLVEACNNLGNLLLGQGMFDQAELWYRKAISISPNLAETHWNLSIILLMSGRFDEGWKEYEWRWRKRDFLSLKRSFSQPRWDGSDPAGRTILLYAEQGFGDMIQFIRYAPTLANKGARVIVECHKELADLFGTVQGINDVVTQFDALPHFDAHCPILSLPFLMRTDLQSIPANIPYIAAPPARLVKWRGLVKREPSARRIGLVWSGNPMNTKLRHKSVSLDVFSPLADINNASFYSLQKGEAASQAKNPPDGMRLIDLTGEINDFADTAAFIDNLDMVITIDTAVAHLAGALGKTVWVLLPFIPDWRWMLDRSESPWYPSMRLFRQPSPGDWNSLVLQACGELKKIHETH